jgi:predicted nuclease of predicted toxin-antitoxin system
VRFKLDENIDVRAAAVLGGALDRIVADVALAEERVLVTLDRGFGDLRAYPPGSHPGIVVLRLRRQALTAVEAALALLMRYEDLGSIGGCTVIVGPATVRVRRPPA